MKIQHIYLGVVLFFIVWIGWLTIYAWRHRRNTGFVPYMWMNIAVLQLLVTIIPLTLTDSPEFGYFLTRLRLIGLSALPALTLIFMLHFTQQAHRLTRWNLAILWFSPFLIQVVVWTPGLDTLFYSTWELVVHDGYSAELRGRGPFYHLFYIIYQLVVYAAAMLLMIYYVARIDSTQRRGGMVILGFSLVGITVAFSPISIGEYPGLPISPLTITMISLGIGYVFTRYESLSVMPVAYDQIVASVHDAVLVLNPEAYIVGFNPAAVRLLNVQREQLMNHPLSSVLTLPPETPLSGEAKAEFEHPIGAAICEVDSLPLLSSKTVIGRILVLRDITARKQAERKALELAFERERAHILSLFIRDASHEFRTPVTVIKTTLYLLARQLDSDKRSKQIDTIAMQIERLSRLIEDLQKMSILDSVPELERVETDLNSFLNSLLIKIASQADGRIIHSSLSIQPLMCAIDAPELDQALMRVVENAIRYSLPGAVIELRARREKTCAYIQIRDSGIGMDADTLKQATQRFYRKDSAHTTAGFGLGLPIAKTIIELHGGTLTLESVVGRGTTVTVQLPLSAQRENRPSAVQSAAD